MTEHFTREEAVALARVIAAENGDTLKAVPEESVANLLHGLCNAAVTAKLKGWDAQGDKAYKRGFSDGMKEAPTGESWIRAIDEAMVGAHIGVAEMADDYGTAKKKLNALICWSVQVDRDLSRAQAAPAVGAPDGYVLVPAEPTPEMIRQGRITPCTADEMDADDDYRAVYKAMIASAQPQQKEG